MTRVNVRYEEVPQLLKHLLQDEGYEEVFEGDESYLVQTYSLPVIINLTPHDINVIGVATVPTSGLVARVSMKTERWPSFYEFPISSTEYGKVEDLPEEISGVKFIVSQMLNAACPDREDLLYPAELVRDEIGNIIGCKSLGL